MKTMKAFLSFLVVSMVCIGCVRQISLKDALSYEYLMMDPEEYQGRDKKLREADEESLNQLFLATYQHGNFALSRYYLSIGANLPNVDFNKKEKEEYIRKLAKFQGIDDYRDLLFESFSRFPELFSWEVEFGNGQTYTALTHFAYALNPENFREIVKLCDDVNLVDEDGRTTLSRLLMRLDIVNGKEEKAKILLDASADPSFPLPDGKNILHYFKWWPIEEDYSEILEIIRESKVDFNKQDDGGETPLHKAVFPLGLSTNSVAYVRFLLENGADKYLADRVGVLPVYLINRYERGFKYATAEEIAARKEIMRQLKELLE